MTGTITGLIVKHGYINVWAIAFRNRNTFLRVYCYAVTAMMLKIIGCDLFDVIFWKHVTSFQ